MRSSHCSFGWGSRGGARGIGDGERGARGNEKRWGHRGSMRGTMTPEREIGDGGGNE